MDFLRDLISAWWLDLFVVFVFAYYATDGYFRGFVRMCFDAAGFVLAFFLALLLYRFPALLVESAFDVPYFFASALSFFALWSIVDLLWPQIMKRIEKRLTPSWKLPQANKVLGVLPGLANGALLMSVLLTVLMAFPVPERIKAQVNDSPIAGPIVNVAAAVDNALKPLFGDLGSSGIHFITVGTDAGDRLDLRFTVHDGRFDHSAEQELLILVNRERLRAGLAELAWSNRLRDAARLHSDDMFRRGYFGHIDPEGATPADRADRLGVPYGTVGENLALAPTVAVAHRGLMDSPGHRANILKPEFKQIGIGAIDGGVYGRMFTQLFSD